MNWQAVLDDLFAEGHEVRAGQGALASFLCGTARFDGRTLAVIGTTDHAEVGLEIALAQARAVLDVARDHPGRAIVLLVDTQGQRLTRRDELLGLNRCMAHLGLCVELARREGHRVIGLVYDQALSGGFLTSAMMADACYALPQAEVRVMRLPAMARVTKLDEQRLMELARSNPVFAPGVDNYVAMGGVRALWDPSAPQGLAAGLRAALADGHWGDRRASDGAARGGRRHAAATAARIEQGDGHAPAAAS
jgi:malonate decarboxylase gamma subunit